MSDRGKPLPSAEALETRLQELLHDTEAIHEKLHELMMLVGKLQGQSGGQATEWPEIRDELGRLTTRLSRDLVKEVGPCVLENP